LAFRVDENEPDILFGCDLMFLAAAQVGHEPDGTGVAIGPRFQRPRPQAAAGKARGKHAHAHPLDDLPDAVQMIWLRHGLLTASGAEKFLARIPQMNSGKA
jgi:hypothetical protein